MPKHVFVDGRDRLDTPCDCDAVIGGDGLVISIAAASIIAKVTRDRLMCALAQDCPGYGFESHKGYACRSISRRSTGSGRACITAAFSRRSWPRGERHQPMIRSPSRSKRSSQSLHRDCEIDVVA
jgi:ribonuclease HII